jgi:hypothetical protein
MIGTGLKKWYWFLMATNRKLFDTYRFKGFRPAPTVTGIFGDPKARVIRLIRRGKKQFVELAGRFIRPFTIGRLAAFETSLAAIPASIWIWKSAGWIAGRVGK